MTDALATATAPQNARRVGVWDRTAIIALGLAAFAQSFDALRQMAAATHVRTQLTPLFPLLVDGFIAYGIRALLVLRNARLRARAYAWLLVGAATATSVWANALHAVRLNQLPVTNATELRLGDSAVGVLATVSPIALAGAVHLYIVLTREAGRTASGGTPAMTPWPMRPATPPRSVRPVSAMRTIGTAAATGILPAAPSLRSPQRTRFVTDEARAHPIPEDTRPPDERTSPTSPGSSPVADSARQDATADPYRADATPQSPSAWSPDAQGADSTADSITTPARSSDASAGGDDRRAPSRPQRGETQSPAGLQDPQLQAMVAIARTVPLNSKGQPAKTQIGKAIRSAGHRVGGDRLHEVMVALREES